MEIRTATPDDVEQLVMLGRWAHAESPRYRGIEFDVERAKDFAHAMLRNPWAAFIVADDAGVLVGAFGGIVVPHFFSDERYASDVFMYVVPERRGSYVAVRLLRRWEAILRNDGRVRESLLGISSEVASDRTRNLYKRLGYRDAGYLMVKHV